MKKHGLMMVKYLHASKAAFGVQADEHADGLAGKALKAAVVQGFIGVTQQLLKLVNRVNRKVRQLVFDHRC